METSPATTEERNAKRRKTRNIISVPQGDGLEDVAIDEYDYHALRDFMPLLGHEHETLWKIVTVQGESRRVTKLFTQTYPGHIDSVPTIGKLECLTYLSLRDEINLKSLPVSIGKLQNLESLDLSHTMLQILPNEIGNLAALSNLMLSGSSIKELPPLIGELRKLKHLQLARTHYLRTIPDEIGDLCSLETLSLRGSRIESIPPSIGRLQNLHSLDVSHTTHLSTFPGEIGHLNNLKILTLEQSRIKSLPESFRRLTGLLYIGLFNTEIPEFKEEVTNETLLTLIQRHQRLGSLGEEMEKSRIKVLHALACNRARSRTPFGTMDGDSMWPLVLGNAIRAFDQYPWHYIRDFCGKYSIPEPDAIYQLINAGKESFIRVLYDRKRKGTL